MVLPIADQSDTDRATDLRRREKIKEMMLHAWKNYEKFAWGSNELRPIARRVHSGGVFGAHKLGATIVESLDTLYIMGLEEQYKRGRDWVNTHLTLDKINKTLPVKDLNSCFLGSMLTLYSFTGDVMYLKKAVHIADKLLPAFETPTGVPQPKINVVTGSLQEGPFGNTYLADFGALYLEFYYLSDLTGNSTYRERVETIRNVLRKMDKPKGLYPVTFNPRTGKWGRILHSSMGKFGGRFYDYLIKAWMQSDYTDKESSEMYKDAVTAIISNMLAFTPKGKSYISDWKYGNLTNQMEQFSCFSGGLLVLGAVQGIHVHSAKYAEVGESIVELCRQSFKQSPTHLGPELIGFTKESQNNISLRQKLYYTLRPEVIESYLIFWRLTHQQKYRDWGWEIVEALEKYCRTPNGYSGLQNVFNDKPQHDDVQRSVFLGQTLKYLYLLFSDDFVLAIGDWIFNSAGHPLPMKGGSDYYRTPVKL
ncbi:uncharacterized protein Dwil_GK18972 [Drosophila willistoni]|uniref:alpha-1,2-Mannosidase n=1 Tax=Drosophila willistoni TaxID=7260 RepID=B4NLE4_DROWI|nr:mannosyl-oligosaccharide alpha-1,2-mannosidase IA [Drosophila willistoni]EDW84347.1 uncharacterized protein Dwil_GK18972 [Drosophila willistoni]